MSAGVGRGQLLGVSQASNRWLRPVVNTMALLLSVYIYQKGAAGAGSMISAFATAVVVADLVCGKDRRLQRGSWTKW